MKRLIQIFSQKWFISSIGIISLIILIWFGGPLLGLGESRPLSSPFNRLLAIVFIILIWGFNNLRHRFKSSKANSAMIESLIAKPIVSTKQTPEKNEELELLQSRFEEAIKHLKSTSLQSRLFGKQYLYELPWYMIIGPPGSGKTTMLDNSGLEFPLKEYKVDHKISGVGGTRNCDWWFTNDAVLLDTAGRYTTQDSNAEEDSKAWLGFLELLQKQRPRRPLNGIIIAISAEDMLCHSQQERELHANTIRQRIQELYKQLGIRIPIYFLLTKLDLVSGFMEFFDDLDASQRSQVWGMTFPQETQQNTDILPLFGAEFDELIKSLNSRQLWRMYQERDLVRRSLINSFPQQMASIKPLIEDFLGKIFTSNRYEQSPLLRGLYLTSGTQEGSPIDRVMSVFAGSLGMNLKNSPAYQGQSRNYFIKQLFNDIIFKESELAGSNVRYEKQRLWLERTAYVATLVLTLGVILAWSSGFTRSEIQISSLKESIENYTETISKLPSKPNLDEIDSSLETAKKISLVYNDDSNTGNWHLGLGSYQSYKLKDTANKAYQRIQQQLLMPYIKQSLEYDMLDVDQEPENLRRLLSIYLMLGNPQSLDPKTFKPWISSNWEKQLNDQPDKQARLNSHLNELLTGELQPQQLDTRLMDQTQRIVCQIPLEKQIYARLKQQAETNIRSFNLSRLSKKTKKVFISTKQNLPEATIPGFYTYDGYHEILVKEGTRTTELTIDENMRICQDDRENQQLPSTEQLLLKVRSRYYDDYIDQWNQFIASIKLIKVSNLDNTLSMLEALSNRESPLQELVRAIAEQTILERAKLKGLLDYFELGKKLNKPQNPIEKAFSPLHKLLLDNKDQPSELADINSELKELNAYISEIAESSDRTTSAFEAAVTRMTQNKRDTIRLLRSNARNLPAPVGTIIESAATQSWGSVLGSARSYINMVWRSSVLPEYRASLENRYPVFKKGRQQTALVDFGRFFGETGSIDNFINTYLSPFIDKRRWRLRSIDGRNLGLSSVAMKQIQRARRIKKMYFQDGGQQPIVRFRLKPIYLDAGVKRFILELNEQQTSYQHGPTRTVKFEWPGIEDNNQVRVIFERFGAGRYSIVKEGPWAWFKLLDSSKMKKKRADKIQVTFSTSGLKARYLIQASSVSNPFSNHEVAKFRCPNRL